MFANMEEKCHFIIRSVDPRWRNMCL